MAAYTFSLICFYFFIFIFIFLLRSRTPFLSHFLFLILFSSKFLQPKHIGGDVWDVAMEKRDKKLMESSSAASLN